METVPQSETASASGPLAAGEALRRRRELLRLDLADVAAALKIKPAYLAALETGRADQLPGPTYAMGFVRAYGDYLGLDGREILRRFKEESAVLDRQPKLSFPIPLGERSMPGGGTLLVALILALCGYGTWYYLSSSERSRPERVIEVPARLLPPKPQQHPVEAAAPRPTEALAGRPMTAPAADAHASPGDAGPRPSPALPPTPAGSSPEPVLASPGAAPAAPSAAALATPWQEMTRTAAIAPTPPSPPSEEPRSSGAADGSTRVVIRATADSWVQIRDANHSVLLVRVLKAGDSYDVPDRPELTMRTGNAGGLEITVDGNPVPSIGRMGMVRRNVTLDPQALIAGTAVRE